MGLFGLFATMVGLGAMAKDGIERSISESKAYEKAVRNGDTSYYTGNGGERYSTKTRRKVSSKTDWDTGHTWIVDARTGQRIEDETAARNKRKTEEEKRKADLKGCVFYRTAQFDTDTYNKKPSIYVSDKIPGYFRVETYSSNGYTIYTKGNLEKWLGEYRVNTINSKERYFANGVRVTQEEMRKKERKKLRERAIMWGYAFYCDLDNPNGMIWFHVDTDEPYLRNVKDQYYAKAKLVEYKYEVQVKPHHDEYKTVTKQYWEEIEDSPRFNLDGTKWVP